MCLASVHARLKGSAPMTILHRPTVYGFRCLPGLRLSTRGPDLAAGAGPGRWTLAGGPCGSLPPGYHRGYSSRSTTASPGEAPATWAPVRTATGLGLREFCDRLVRPLGIA